MASHKTQHDLAIRLVLAIKRLRARLRETWPTPVRALPTTQLAILKRLRDDGATTATALAEAEHVSHQAIGQHVSALRDARLVRTAADPSDGRKTLVTITASGLKLFDSVAESRNDWLQRAIAMEIPASEHDTLAKAVEILERLAAADVSKASAPD